MHKPSVHDFSQPDTGNQAVPVYLVAGYLFFVIYGSLVPFSWNGLAFDTAWENFQHIPLLELGVASRADLVANLLLYIPLGLLTCGLFTGRSRDPLVLATGIVLSLLFSTVIALAVEFTQQFFSPRTVSLNDLYAEFAGALSGALLWPLIGMRLQKITLDILHGGKNARHAALLTYTLVYLILSFFPYDLLLSYDEWQQKLTSGQIGWLFAPSCGNSCAWKLIPEALLVAPLAIFLFQPLQRTSLILAATTGIMLGVLIEGLQLTIVSGISQGASIISRMAGMMLGTALIQISPRVNWYWLHPYIRPLLLLGLIPYLGVLVLINYRLSGNWLGLTEGIERLKEIHFLPFYYHYFTTELVALMSLLLQAGAYLPVGIGFWLWHRTKLSFNSQHYCISRPGVTAGVLSCVIEAGKLFSPDTHPDPTNVLIAAVSASLVCYLLNLLFPVKSEVSPNSGKLNIPQTTDSDHKVISGSNGKAADQINDPAKITSQHNRQSPPPTFSATLSRTETSAFTGASEQLPSPSRRPGWPAIAGTIALLLAGIAAITSPLGALWVSFPLIIYSALLWWRPDLWLVWVLAFLPLLDLTPWSGRLYWTEYDTLLLATAGIGYLRLCFHPYTQPILRRPAALALALFVISTAISLGIALFPLSPLDQNAFTSYYSSYNGLRSVKGILFALLFIPLLAREWNAPETAARRLALGMSLGFAAEILYVLWERITFPGLFNFETDYRITGSFHGMHTGGAYIEGFLVLAAPFTVLWAWQQRNTLITLLTIGLYCLGAYCVMVTFSRGGQIAFGLVTVLLATGFSGFVLRRRTRIFSSISITILITVLAGTIAWPILSGPYSQSRFATVEKDVVTRADHWQDSIDIALVRGNPVFGMGSGSFPYAFFWYSSVPARPSTYTFATEDKNTYLQLGSGETLYFEQPVAVEPGQRYMLTMNLRSQAPNAAITAPVCEKALLYSFRCFWLSLRLDKVPPGKWGYYEAAISTSEFNTENSRVRRPAKLSLYNGQPDTTVDVDNISLKDAEGNDLVLNGDFSDGMSHWFFSTDSHLPWHIKNLFLHIFFEQGWFGLACFIVLTGYLLTRGLIRTWHNDVLHLVLCISLGAFLAIGIVDSLIDEPRLAFLFYLLMITGSISDTHPLPLLSGNRTRNTA
ncbi:O-antigen ligase family protein [Nitrosomonas europaea]|uniref:O-antigen ligase family protein n=1 Tax=Nitrosomonas europaea TaxID=915 RepID=UPI000792FE99|nr:O-antigen ligase family protein [Nitrosomonas europaea]KXK37033.1 MAG: VanZ like family protein [Nitrosomonas europaea]